MFNEDTVRLEYMRLLAARAPLSQILDYTESITGIPVLFQDGTLFTLGWSQGYDNAWPKDFSMVILEDKAEQERLCAEFEAAILPDSPPTIMKYPHMPSRTLLMGIFVDGKLSGILRMTERLRSLDDLTAEQIALLREVFSLVAMIYATAQVESLPDRAFRRMLLGTLSSPVAIENCDVLSGISHNRRYQLICIRQQTPAAGENTLRRELVALLGTEWVTDCEGIHAVLLFGGGEGDLLMPDMADALRAFAQHRRCLICISDEYDMLHHTHAIFCDIRDHFSTLKKDAVGLSSFDLCKLPLLISRIRGSLPLEKYYSSAVLRIIAYDEENKSDYLRTLQAYAACEKNAGAAAQQLFIHKNTMLYRIARLKEISRADLDDPDQWLHIRFTLLAMNQQP